MKKLLIDLCYQLAEWSFRRRDPGVYLVGAGIGLLATLLTTWSFSVNIPVPGIGTIPLTVSSGDGGFLDILRACLSAALILTGLVMIWRGQDRKRVVAIELRGLRDTSGDPLKDSIPARFAGRRDQILINVRQGADGRLLDPEAALPKVTSLPASIQNIEGGLQRGDIQYVAGGIAPIAYGFLTGVLLDDESRVELMDWDRDRLAWRALDADDDGLRFRIEGNEGVGQAHEIVLAVSVSYPTDSAGIAEAFAGLPVVRMVLENGSVNAHWSAQKQVALTAQFRDFLIGLRATLVRRIHLVLAAPTSLVIRFGCSYDKRNLPEIVVYQYEIGDTPKFPWGVLMPVSGVPAPRIVRRDLTA